MSDEIISITLNGETIPTLVIIVKYQVQDIKNKIQKETIEREINSFIIFITNQPTIYCQNLLLKSCFL